MKKVLIFLVLALTLPVICLLPGFVENSFNSSILGLILFGIEAMTPSIAALIVVFVFDGHIGIKTFLKKSYVKNIRIELILLAFMIPLLVLLVSRLTANIFTGQENIISTLSVKKFIIILWALVAEELGWRGFLQDAIDKYIGFIWTPIIIGSIWALWHYHFFISGKMTGTVFLFWLGCILDSYGYYWITRKSSGNVIPASVWHFSGNLFMNLFFISSEKNGGSIIPNDMFVGYSAIMAITITIWGVKTLKKNQNNFQE